MNTIDRIIGGLVWSTLAISATGILLLAILGATDIFALWMLDTSVPSAVELSSSLLAAVVFGSLAATQRAGANIEVSLILDLLPDRVAALSRRLFLGLATIVLIYVAWRLSTLAGRSFATREFATGLWGFPLYPIKIWCASAVWVAVLEFAWQSLVKGPAQPASASDTSAVTEA